MAAQEKLDKLMSRMIFSAFLVSLVASSVGAMTADVDTDGDGFASMAELQAIYPDLTEEQFLEIDTDGDGLVNDEEMLIAVEAELIADPEGDA
jgi:hypothetical protein